MRKSFKSFSKKAIALVLSLLMLMSSFAFTSFTAFAEDDTYTVYYKDVNNWGSVFVYFGAYWDAYNSPSKGAGAADRNNLHQMTLIEGSDNVYKYTFSSSTPNYSSTNIAFTKAGQASYDNFWNTQVSYRGDFSYSSGKMFVPSTTISGTYNDCTYYNNGNWYAFNEYPTFGIYNSADSTEFAELTRTGESTYTATVEFTEDMLADTYSFYVYDSDFNYYYNAPASTTITSDNSSATLDYNSTVDSASYYEFIPTVAGTYTFTVNTLLGDYDSNAGTFSVTYPVDASDVAIDMTDRTLYLIGPNFGKDVTDTNYPLQAVAGVENYYWYQGVPRDLLTDSNGTFYFSDGTTAIGAASNTVLADTDSNENGSYYTDNDSFAIVGKTGTFICSTVPAGWNYVNITVDSVTGQVWIFETPVRDYDISNAVANLTIELNSTDVDDETNTEGDTETVVSNTSVSASYNDSVTLYASVSGVLRDGEDYTGNIIYNFYEMVGGTLTPTEDTFLGSVTSDSGEAQLVVDGIKSDSTFYFVAAPSSTPSASFYSNMTYVNISDELVVVEDVDVYFDFDTNTVDEPVYIYTMENDGTTTITQMTLLSGTNIYTAKVDASYYLDPDGNIYTNFKIYKVTMGDVEVGLKDEDQPDINKIISSKTVWYKTTGEVESNFIEGTPFSYDDDLMLDENDTPYYTNSYVYYNTVRIYLTNVYCYEGLAVRWGETLDDVANNEYVNMSLVAVDNKYEQDYYYYDIPKTANYVQFKGVGEASFSPSEGVTINAKKDHEFPAVKLSTDLDSDTDNAYYMDWQGSTRELFYTVKLWPDYDTPHSPQLISYYSNTKTTKNTATSVMPTEFYATLSVSYDGTELEIGDNPIYDSEDNLLYNVELVEGAYTLGDNTYTGVVDIIVTGYVTGEDNILTLSITPEGDLLDSYDPTDITVQFFDKDELNNALANALAVIQDQSATPHYTGDSFYAVSNAYYEYLSVYRSSFDQDEIDAAAATLKEALDNLEPLAVADPSWFDIISYKSATITFTHNGYGSVSKPISRGYVQQITNGYSVLYAAYDGTATFPFTVTDIATRTLQACPFMYWAANSSTVITDTTVSIASAVYTDANYVAYFQPEDSYPVKVVYHYNVYSPEDSRTYEYKEGYTVPATYTTTVADIAVESIDNEANWNSVVVGMAPIIANEYFDYELDLTTVTLTDYYNENAAEGEDIGYYQFDAYLTETPHMYTVSVNGRSTGETYHFQEMIDISASTYTSASNVYWYNMTDSTAAISTKATYSVRVTENLELGVTENINNLDVLFTSVITNGYAEISYDDNQTKKLHQNFYIQNFIDANDDTVKYLGSGVFYYAYNTSTGKPVKSQVTSSVLSNISTYAMTFADKTEKTSGSAFVQNYKSTGLSYSYIPITDDWLDYGDDYETTWDVYDSPVVDYRGMTDVPYPEEVIVRYSSKLTAFNYFFDAVNTYNVDNVNLSYMVYSFFLYEDANGEVQVALCANPASAACYVTESDILGQ